MSERKVIPATRDELNTLMELAGPVNEVVPMNGSGTAISVTHPHGGWAVNELAKLRGIPPHRLKRQAVAG